MHLAAEHPSPVQIEAGSSQSACNDAVNSLLAKQTLFKGGGGGGERAPFSSFQHKLNKYINK